jgi:hypothetical protein
MLRGVLYAVCLFSLPLFAFCSQSDDSSQKDLVLSQTGQAPLPSDLTITFGEGGGVTGMWEGFTIHPDGAVLRWHGREPGADPQQAGRLPETTRRALWTEIGRMDFFNNQSSEAGDLTRFVQVIADKKSHRVQWVPQMGHAQEGHVLTVLYKHCQAMVAKAERPQ